VTSVSGSTGAIAPHRTLITLPLSWLDAVGAAALSMTFAVAAFFTAPHMFAMWRWIFVKGSALLELGGRLEYAPSTFLPTSLPFLAVDAAPPGRAALVVGAVTVVALLAVAQRFVATVLPMAYFIRAVAFILATAVIVFGVGTGSPTLNLTTYVRAMLQVSVGIWMLIPLLYGLTLFLLDIGQAARDGDPDHRHASRSSRSGGRHHGGEARGRKARDRCRQ